MKSTDVPGITLYQVCCYSAGCLCEIKIVIKLCMVDIYSIIFIIYSAALLMFPYYNEPQVLQSLPDFSMMDYKLDYCNHQIYTSGKY